MGDPISTLIKSGLDANAPELLRSFAEYSYVLKARDIHGLRDGDNLVAEFDMFAGSWIFFAKSTFRAPGGDGIVDVQLTLSATEGATVHLDRAKASVVNSHYSTVCLLLGARLATGGKVRLAATAQGIERSAEVVDTVIAAVKMDKLLVWDL
jgi:hypothetical protein